jgi:lipoyl(octanoyl) transferase
MKNTHIQFLDLGVCDYKIALASQEDLLKQIISIKLDRDTNGEPSTPNFLLFVEHPAVYTLGKSGDEHNLLLNYIQLQDRKAAFYKTDRGGDITFHGPGQLVGYPILDLENFTIGLRQYIYSIEEVIIQTISMLGLSGTRDPDAAGVWLDVGTAKARKICAIGVKSSRSVTMHGFALNVNTDLSYFKDINPCGFSDKGVTSLQNELGEIIDFDHVKAILRDKFAEVFGASIDKMPFQSQFRP